MNPLFIDFETHYEPDGGYSLSKMPTMQYVRDRRFECLGVALGALNNAWKPGPETAPALESVDWPNTAAVAHNAAFDAAVLYHHFGHRPALWIDTYAWCRWAISQGAAPPDARLSLKWWGEYLGLLKGDTAAAVGAGGQELADYAMRDIEILQALVAWLQEHAPWPDDEMRFADVHVRMAAEPCLGLDETLLAREAEVTADPELVDAVRSRETFARLLRERGVEPGTKTSPANGKQTYAFAKTDMFMRELAGHPDPVVRALHKLKTEASSTIKASRAQRFLNVGSPMPMPQAYYGAHTGRSTGLEKLNVLNLPRGDFRSALVAPPGHKILVADYSQIEARVIAWGAGDEHSLDIFRSGRDPYREVASRELYNVDYDKVTDEQRRRAKAAVLALGFGQGANGFHTYCRTFGIDMDIHEAQRIVRAYRGARPRLVAFWHGLFDKVCSTGELVLPSGRKLTYPGMERTGREVTFLRHRVFSKSPKRDRVNLWHGLVAENWTQAVARDILMHAVVRLPKEIVPVLLPYDEIVAVVHADTAEHCADALTQRMLDAPSWAEGLPLAVDKPVICDNYGEVKQ